MLLGIGCILLAGMALQSSHVPDLIVAKQTHSIGVRHTGSPRQRTKQPVRANGLVLAIERVM